METELAHVLFCFYPSQIISILDLTMFFWVSPACQRLEINIRTQNPLPIFIVIRKLA